MTLQFSWDFEDAKTFVFQNEYPSAVFKFSYWFLAVIGTFVGAGNFLIDSEFKVGASIFLVAGLAAFYWLFVGRRLQARKMHNETQMLIENYEINNHEIIQFYDDLEDEKTSSQWNNFSLCIESEHHFLLYNKKELLLLFPKRAFLHQSDISQFREWSKNVKR